MKHPLDQRKARYQPDHEAARALAEGREAWLDQQFKAARYLCRMSHRNAFFGPPTSARAAAPSGSSLGQLANLLGYDGSQAPRPRVSRL